MMRHGRYCQVKFTLCYKIIPQVFLSQFDNDFFVSCIKIFGILIQSYTTYFPPFVEIVIFLSLWGREDVASWLAHGRELREIWCCPLPKGLGTNQGVHGQPHSKWLVKQLTNKETMEPSLKTKQLRHMGDPNKLQVLKSYRATVMTNDFELNILKKFCCK